MKAAERLLLCLICLFTVLPVAAQVYTYKDADGNPVFTDQPRPGAKRIELGPSNSVSVPTTPTRRITRPVVAPVQVVHYDMLRILVPLPDAGVQQDDGALIVTVTSDPPLLEGNYYRLLLDDQAGEPSRSPVFALQNVDRGEHKLSAEIIDDRGHVLERTASQPFFMQRISLMQKRRVHPCQPEDYGVRPECPLADKPTDD